MSDVMIKLESIGDDHREKLRLWQGGRIHMSADNVRMCRSLMGRRPFVKVVTGVNYDGRPIKKLIKFHKDYSESMGTGGRGIFYWYSLKDRHCYQIQRQISWKKSEKIYVAVREGKLIEITENECSLLINHTMHGM